MSALMEIQRNMMYATPPHEDGNGFHAAIQRRFWNAPRKRKREREGLRERGGEGVGEREEEGEAERERELSKSFLAKPIATFFSI